MSETPILSPQQPDWVNNLYDLPKRMGFTETPELVSIREGLNLKSEVIKRAAQGCSSLLLLVKS